MLDAADGAGLINLDVDGRIKGFQFTNPGGNLIVVTDQGKLTEWDPKTAEMKREGLNLNQSLTKLVFDRAAGLLAVGTSEQISLISLRNDEILLKLEIPVDRYGSFALSADGKRLAVSPGLSKSLLLFDTQSGAHIASMAGHSKAASSALFSPDGKILVSGGRDTRVVIWDGLTGEFRSEYESNHGTALGFSHDSRHFFVRAGADVLAMIDVETGEAVAGFKMAGEIVDLAVSPDNSKLYIAVAAAGATVSYRLECWHLPVRK